MGSETRYWQSGQTGLVFAGDTPPLIHEPGWREVIPVPKSEHEGLLRLKAAVESDELAWKVYANTAPGFDPLPAYRAVLRERMKGGGV